MQFFFHTNCKHDLEGVDLPSVAAAKRQAVKLAAQLICEEAENLWDTGDWRLTVANESGLTMFQLEMFGTDAPSIRPARYARRVSA